MGRRKVENAVFGAVFFLALAGAGCGRVSDGLVQGGLTVGVLEGVSENIAGEEKMRDNVADLGKREENAMKPEESAKNGAESEKTKENTMEPEESAKNTADSEKREESSKKPEESAENTAVPDKNMIEIPEQAGNEAQEPTGTTVSTASYSYDGTVFEYDGTAYDMRERDSMVNAIMDCFPVGEYIVIESHTGPHNARYTIFNTQTQEFEKDIAGTMLTFYNDDIHTAVYACWNDICTYDGTVLAKLDIGQYDIIRDISFSEDHTQLKVSIYENGTDEQQLRVELLQLPDFPD